MLKWLVLTNTRLLLREKMGMQRPVCYRRLLYTDLLSEGVAVVTVAEKHP